MFDLLSFKNFVVLVLYFDSITVNLTSSAHWISYITRCLLNPSFLSRSSYFLLLEGGGVFTPGCYDFNAHDEKCHICLYHTSTTNPYTIKTSRKFWWTTF